MAAPGLGPPNLRVSTQENKGASVFESFDGASRYLARRKALADGGIALQGWLGVEHGVVHLLWVAIFEGVFLADV